MNDTPLPHHAPASTATWLPALIGEGRRTLSARVEALLAEKSASARVHVGLPTCVAYAALHDEVMTQLYRSASDSAPPNLAVAAVGGYGRGVLAFGSDLDIRLLTPEPEAARPFAEALLYPLWDAGIAVGHQVVSADELMVAARQDLPTATALLDWRTLAGDADLSQQLLERAARSLFASSALSGFVDRLEAEADERHRRFGGSVYLLEPDLKNGPGGLRDLDLARWAAHARWQVRTLDALVPLGVLVPRQLAVVTAARELLWSLRNALHHRAGRRRDRLNFDEQEAIAHALGFTGSLREAVERMMRDYYRAARTVSRFRDMIMARARPQLRRRKPVNKDLGDGLQLFDGEVTVARSNLIFERPLVALQAVAAAVLHDCPLRPHFRNRLVSACSDVAWAARLRADEQAARLFVQLVTCCKLPQLKAGTVLRELHDVGLLLAMIPEFSPLVGRVHHDTYHVFTVDAHSVAAVDRLGELVRGDVVFDEREGQPWRGSLAAQLGADLARPQVLFFATLLHDVGKAIGRADHSERGADLARTILARLPFTPHEVDDVCQWVRHHLTMYRIATRRDVDDPATAAEVATLVGDQNGLRELYLLTVADLSTTSPTSMTAWKAHMLDALYVATARHLAAGAITCRRRDDAADRAAALAPAHRDWVRALVEAMPVRYRATVDPAAMAEHALRVRTHLLSGQVASMHVLPRRNSTQPLCVVATDRPGLLADITAALANNRLQVHAADIYSCPTRRLAPLLGTDGLRTGAADLAVDLFWVQSASPTAVQVRRAERDLQSLLTGARNGEALMRPRLKARSRRSQPAVATRVLVDNRVSQRHTIIEVFTGDRPGLLYMLARALYARGISIVRAKIATEGQRAVDVFYVHDGNGQKIVDPCEVAAVRTAVRSLFERALLSPPPDEPPPPPSTV